MLSHTHTHTQTPHRRTHRRTHARTHTHVHNWQVWWKHVTVLYLSVTFLGKQFLLPSITAVSSKLISLNTVN